MDNKKVIVVFGAGNPDNIGYGIYKKLADEGNIVYPVDINGDFDSLVKCDATNAHDIDLTMNAIFCKEHRIDAVVITLGVNLLGALSSYTEHDWNKTIDVNLKAPMLITQKFYNLCKQQDGTKTVVYIGSNTAYIPRTKTFAYGASKAGLTYLTKALARELAPDKFAIIQLDMGVVEGTPMHQKTHKDLFIQRGWNEEETNEQRLANIPWKRYSNPEEVAEWVKFLINSGEYATGNCIRVDGAEK